MVNQTLLNLIATEVVPKSWESACIARLNTSSTFDFTQGLVRGNGEPMSKLTNSTWGIGLATCLQECNDKKIPFIFNFQSFASAMTNYFLPWLALTAQLPFETGDFLSNGMAFCLAVGSPALVTYSLAITILNRYWVRKRFDERRSDARNRNVSRRSREILGRIQAAEYLLQEGQQVPLRACQEKGWFSSLIVISGNAEWWRQLERRLRSTRRGVTASLVSQMLFAGIAYLFTVISSFDAELGDPTTALQIASGSLWIWLIPIIAGWITVGTQYSHRSIEDALEAYPAVRALPPPIQSSHECSEPETQEGLIVDSELTPQPHGPQTVRDQFHIPEKRHLEIPSWMGAAVGGDEQRKGPIYNYARIFTWWQLASSIDAALRTTMEHIGNGEACPPDSAADYPKWDDIANERTLLGDSGGVASYCGLITAQLRAYPTWGSIPSEIYRRIAAASVIALFLQWGTTGASIVIAYVGVPAHSPDLKRHADLTPTIGLGCRSASYLLYGTIGTAAWICLLLSMLISHEAMLLYQAEHLAHPARDFRKTAGQYQRTLVHSILCALAVSLRYIGKFLAFANTLWLVASSLMEFVGVFDNCFCKSNYIGMGEKGWVVLFKGAEDLAAAARLPWGGGLALTLSVCFISYTFFFFGSVRTEDD